MENGGNGRIVVPWLVGVLHWQEELSEFPHMYACEQKFRWQYDAAEAGTRYRGLDLEHLRGRAARA